MGKAKSDIEILEAKAKPDTEIPGAAAVAPKVPGKAMAGEEHIPAARASQQRE